MLAPIIHDVLSQGRPQSAHVGKQVLAGRVHIHTDGVYAELYGLVKTVLQFGLVHIVLVLSHANALGVDLYQFGQRIHESPADADGPPDGDILVGKLLAGHLRG